MRLTVDIRVARGTREVASALESEAHVAGLFGPSGIGKTTTLHAIAGLLRPTKGTIKLGDDILDDAANSTHMPTHKRGIGYVFQEGRLFPHYSVAGNLRYGLRFSARAPNSAKQAAIVEMLGIGDLMKRWPMTLSGGEKQRVAIARALFAGPRLLLLDEPLSSLDEARKAEALPFLKRMCQEGGVPTVYVSHDRRELEAVGARIVAMRATTLGMTPAIP